jgi:hypothetical protein
MAPDFRHRISSWRQVYGELAHAPHGDEWGAPDELLETHLELLHNQCIQLVQARDRYYAGVKAYVEQQGRPADQQAFVENAGAASLKAFTQSSALDLQLAILRSERAQREAARVRPVIIHAPPQPQSLVERLLGR